MKLIPFGGSQSIGGSTNYLALGGLHFLIDAGARPHQAHRKTDYDALARLAGLSSASQFDAILITHAHQDHAGGLLDLLSQAPEVPTYFHPYTGELARTYFESRPGLDDPYGRKRGYLAFLRALEANRGLRFCEPFVVGGKPGTDAVEVTLLPAGHLPGAACVRLRTRETCALFTGDFDDKPGVFFSGTAQHPEFDATQADLLVLEATYAGRERLSGPGILAPEALASTVSRVIRRCGVALLPAFAIGRAQEVLGLLARDFDDSLALSIWMDRSIRRFGKVYERLYAELMKDSRLARFVSWTSSGEELEQPPLERPGVILATPGMLRSGTLSGRCAFHILQDPRNAVILCGHQQPNTLGGTLQTVATSGKCPEGIYTGMGYTRLRADIYRCQLSAHAGHQGLVEMVRRTRAGKVVLVHRHGDEEALRTFREDVAPTPVLTPANGERVVW